eukprot:CAMPEP_0204888610 /NCGR_PEP_ID=MMETSP1349-20130617/20711_1 /ASSEMBLY_ACC=CAM_ASM_000710 /TAXON_ID=215587 /ORGANISM="Aplanochytrium stocchinoi, Strain GSBS06" /LENGTH=84 /DNA_ID=CAMNT_0052052165 /DNA_START=209 /DNA_END=459 /DNA_ORIENTATION=+
MNTDHDDFAFNDDNRLKKKLQVLERLCKYPQWLLIPVNMIDKPETNKDVSNESKYSVGKASSSIESLGNDIEEEKYIWVNVDTA